MPIIKHIRKTNQVFKEQTAHVHWGKLTLTILALIGVSFGLAFLFLRILPPPNYDYAWLAYLTVFLSSLVANLTIIAPVPIGITILVTAAATWNPVMVALAASVGASIGELSGYYAGRLGRKIAIPESALWHSRFEKWIQRWGAWAIFVLGIQPVLPFDVAGIIAGTAKMPVRKFLLALWAGRFPKYIIFAYLGDWIIRHIPFLAP